MGRKLKSSGDHFAEKKASKVRSNKPKNQKHNRKDALDLIREKRWDSNFLKLEKYVKRHGTWRVKKSHDIRLSEWLKRQKRKYESLSLKRRSRLEQVGVKGTHQTSNEAWLSKYAELRLFKETHGHLVVGKVNKPLFEWIHNQKWMKKHGKLTAEREMKLARIGFVWSGENLRIRQKHWEMMFAKFSRFQRKHGLRYILVLKEHKDLQAWVDSQKHNKRKLSLQRVNRLNGIQFPWKTRYLQIQARKKLN